LLSGAYTRKKRFKSQRLKYRARNVRTPYSTSFLYPKSTKRKSVTNCKQKRPKIALLVTSVKVSQNSGSHPDNCCRFSNRSNRLLRSNASAFAKHFPNTRAFICANNLAYTNLYVSCANLANVFAN
jgi:hypothetical protein